MPAPFHPPITESTDHPLVCEYHEVFLIWFESGGPESGPGEPYLACPACMDEAEHPMIHCDRCGVERRTERTSLVNPADPTVAYHLACGHTVI